MLAASILLATLGQPPPAQTAAYARWMASTLTFGSLSSTSTRSDASTPGDAFGNPYSFADIGGVPYLYASDLDASMIDLFTAATANPRGTLALSDATLTNPNGTSVVADCEIGEGYGDPENPPCARLVLSGVFSKVPVGSDEEAAGKAALLARHPFIANLPDDHSFYVAKISVDAIWLIAAYGGASIVAPEDYFGAAAPSVEEAAASVAKRVSAAKAKKAAAAERRRGGDGPPPFFKQPETARWMVKTLTYTFLATTSTRTEGSKVGDAFGNPYGIADVDGVPYLYGTNMDASFTDLFVGHNSSRGTLAFSEATLSGDALPKACTPAPGTNGDPENPPCARLVLSGVFSKVAANSTEEAAAKQALFARHPSYVNYPAEHGFYVAKLNIDGIWLIAMYGGAANIPVADYMSVKSA